MFVSLSLCVPLYVFVCIYIANTATHIQHKEKGGGYILYILSSLEIRLKSLLPFTEFSLNSLHIILLWLLFGGRSTLFKTIQEYSVI